MAHNMVMGATTLVSVAEYLSSSYEPDVDYVDGELEDRNVGEKTHAKLQLRLVRLLDRRGDWFVTIETRTQVSPTRFRVPDVCVYEEEPDEEIFHAPPLLVIEVLSPEDRMSRMQRKMEDYFAMGCKHVWILDPSRQKAYVYDGTSIVETQGTMTTDVPRLSLRTSEIFPQK
jgi:Uma2 family endonuclease